ncbi:MAG: glycosyltransferase family 2 protein [Oscillospiraceae bacterium]|nr:glycosyltransferase family 2 protein [Oscillospiraceae bacterium]
MNKTVSVIIPVFNVEDYAAECFDSILAQEHQDFEVIIVNDGSTDGSGAICDAYAARDSRFHVIHTENRGVGQARNLAMEQMSGEYCFFLDPDDVLEPFTFSYLMQLLEDNHADIALGVSKNFRDAIQREETEKKEYVHRGKKEIIEGVIFDKNDLKPLERKTEKSVVNWEFFSSLYKTALLKEKQIRFLPISYGEDTYVAFAYLLEAQTAVTTSLPVYWHRRNPTSTTFRYHPDYLDETKKYYRYYFELFEQKAPDYLELARIGLDAQYYRRCVSAIERELFLSPPDRGTKEKSETIRTVRNDPKFSEMFTAENIRRTPKGRFRTMLFLFRRGIIRPTVRLLACRKR